MKNTKGLSMIVTTLILVLLVLVAVGILWGPIKNLLGNTTDKFGNNAICLDLSLKPIKIQNASGAGNYTVTIERTATGIDENIGAMVVLYNDESNSQTITLTSMFGKLDTLTESIETDFNSTNEIKVIPYFLDDVGTKQICSNYEIKSYALVDSSS
ncbi:MAG: hypothetical protein U9Q99_01810 [Nanoarchaeota archaeon]|nr:hypothetical protein [Nanoarchaeota archaeon]